MSKRVIVRHERTKHEKSIPAGALPAYERAGWGVKPDNRKRTKSAPVVNDNDDATEAAASDKENG